MNVIGLLGRGHLPGADGPDGLVGDDQFRNPLPSKTLEGSADLGLHHCHGLFGFALGKSFPNADDGAKVVVGGSHRLGRDGGVGLVEILPPLRMTEDDVAYPQVAEHGAGNFAGEGTLLGLVHVLGAQGQNAMTTQGLAGDRQGGEGWADHHVDVGDLLDSLNDILDQAFGV